MLFGRWLPDVYAADLPLQTGPKPTPPITMSATHQTLPDTCPNCDAAVSGPFCSQCGQETVITVLSLREFGHEYFQTFVTLEGRLWRSLWLLVTQPGRLTTEFLAGRRRRYVRPLPLYLSMSFIFFLVLALSGVAVKTGEVMEQADPASLVQIDEEDRKTLREARLEEQVPQWLKPVVDRYEKSLGQFNGDSTRAVERLSVSFLAKLPYAMFFLLPAFALATSLFYFRCRRAYTEHLLFALHLHAFAFLCLSVVVALPGEPLVGPLLLLWWGHLALALRRMFGGSLIGHVIRAVPLFVGHSVVLIVVMLSVLMIAIPTM